MEGHVASGTEFRRHRNHDLKVTMGTGVDAGADMGMAEIAIISVDVTTT